MRPMAETFFWGRTPDGRVPKRLAGCHNSRPTFFSFLGSVVAFVPQLGEEKKKGQGGERIRWSRVNQQRATDLASGEGEEKGCNG